MALRRRAPSRVSARAAALALAAAAPASVHALENGLARTPYMGFNSWNAAACNVNETWVRANAAALVSLGLDKLG
jgi:hypothetical protein